MIKFKFKFEKETITAECPTSWDEVTVKQAQALDFKTWDGIDIVKVIADLAEVDVSKLYETRSQPLEVVYKVLEFLRSKPPIWEEIKHKKVITLWGKEIKVPEDLEAEPFGCKVEFEMKAEQGDLAYLTAIYLQPILHGKIDPGLRDKVYKDLLAHPYIEVKPIVDFFFQKFRDYMIYGRAVLNLYQ